MTDTLTWVNVWFQRCHALMMPTTIYQPAASSPLLSFLNYRAISRQERIQNEPLWCKFLGSAPSSLSL